MKIALVGSAPSSVHLGPYRDRTYAQFVGAKQPMYPPSPWLGERWEVWGCSPGAYGAVPRADRWFEVHRWEPGAPWFGPEYCQFLREFDGPVYTGGPVPEIKNHVPYPIAQVEALFSSYFLNSSLSLMMAMAIIEIEDRRAERRQAAQTWAHAAKVAADQGSDMMPGETLLALLNERDSDDEIGMWGVDMAAHEEYGGQRKGCHFFILEALRRGIAFYCPPESDLMRPEPVYGLAEWDHAYIKATARARELSTQRGHLQEQHASLTAQLQQHTGYTAGFDDFIKTWLSPYGLPHGEHIRMEPGTGLGGGVTRTVGTPVAVQPAPPPIQLTTAGVAGPTEEQDHDGRDQRAAAGPGEHGNPAGDRQPAGRSRKRPAAKRKR